MDKFSIFTFHAGRKSDLSGKSLPDGGPAFIDSTILQPESDAMDNMISEQSDK